MPFEWFGDAFNRKIEQKVIDNLSKAAIMVENDAKKVCPVRTGRLRGSITHKLEEKDKTALVGTDVHYAIYVEMGTVKMAARPYLRPSLEKNKAEIRKMFGA